MPAERLQKVLAAAGVASRRSAEAMIAAGRVTVDGRVAGLGAQADPERSIIAVDGRVIGSAASHAYLVLHKPAGVTSTTRDRHAETTVLDLVPTALVPDGARLYPVGRLDQDSEGMLLLTNDGAWADRVLHPRHGVEREYALGLDRPLDSEQVAALQHGIPLDEGLATLGGLRLMTGVETDRLAGLLRPSLPALTWYRATLTQGWKRQLRRMFGAVGAPVHRLVRVRIGPVRIDGLRSGAVRPLKAPEVRGLGAGAGRARATGAQPRRSQAVQAAAAEPDRSASSDRYPSRDGRVGGHARRAGVVGQEQRRRGRRA
jgi:23S rRNA pseudouridine2605 synthase